jgi:hypothetical protein
MTLFPQNKALPNDYARRGWSGGYKITLFLFNWQVFGGVFLYHFQVYLKIELKSAKPCDGSSKILTSIVSQIFFAPTFSFLNTGRFSRMKIPGRFFFEK